MTQEKQPPEDYDPEPPDRVALSKANASEMCRACENFWRRRGIDPEDYSMRAAIQAGYRKAVGRKAQAEIARIDRIVEEIIRDSQ